MRALRLDFARSRASGRVGAVLLAAGLLAAIGASAQFAALTRETEAWEARAADLKSMSERSMKRVGAGAGDATALGGEVRSANAILAQMSVPWNALFRELEGAGGPNVSLLSVHPDIAGRQVRIAGEARNMQAALDYVAKLEETGTLRRVVLTGHETKQSGTQSPVGFSLAAEWGHAS